MSKRNTLENKQLRQRRKELKRELNKESIVAQPVAKYGICEVTGRWLPVDFVHSICEPAWIQIARFVDNPVPRFKKNRAALRQNVVQKDKQIGQGYDWNREWNW